MTFPLLLAADAANDGKQPVTMPNKPSMTCRVRVQSVSDTTVFGDTGNFTIELRNAVNDMKEKMPQEFALMQNHPNPFNPTTVIEFDLPRTCQVKLEILNVRGERVAMLVDEMRTPGHYTEPFTAKGLASGLYFYRIQAGDFVQTKKLVIKK